MSDDRLEQARAEAERSVAGAYTSEQEQELASAFMLGVRWADAHQYSTPEALVAAYEEGQRDAVDKGLAKARVTSARLHHVAWMLQNLPEDKIAAMLPGLLGIEVRDE